MGAILITGGVLFAIATWLLNGARDKMLTLEQIDGLPLIGVAAALAGLFVLLIR